MRFFVGGRVSGTEEFFHITPPCAGYYTNVRVQVYQGGASENNWIYFGKHNLNLLNFTLPITDEIETIMPDLGNKGLVLTFMEGASGEKVYATKYMKKNLHVKKGDTVMMYFATETSSDISFMVQGDFIPYRGAELSIQQQLQQATAIEGDHEELTFIVPTRMRGRSLSVEIQVKATEYSASVNAYHVRRGYELFRSDTAWALETLSSTSGDILTDVAEDEVKDVRSRGVSLGRHMFDNSDSAVVRFVFPVDRMLEDGDMIFLDFDNMSASSLTEITVFMELRGEVAQKTYSRGGSWLLGDNPNFIDLDEVTS